MSIYKSLLTLILGASGFCAWAQLPVPAPTSSAHTSSFPPVGVALTETMQVNLYNQASNPTAGTAASCNVVVSFANAAGTTITGTGGTFTVTSGQTQSVMLAGMKANTSSTNGSRAEVRAVISLTTTRGTPCSLVDSLETFDSTTGATHVYLVGSVLNEVGFPLSIF